MARLLFKMIRLLFKITQLLFKMTRLLFKMSRLLFKMSQLLFKITRLLFKITRLLFKLTRFLFKMRYNECCLSSSKTFILKRIGDLLALKFLFLFTTNFFYCIETIEINNGNKSNQRKTHTNNKCFS